MVGSDLSGYIFYDKIFKNNLYVPYELKVAYRCYVKLIPSNVLIKYYENNLIEYNSNFTMFV